ncbi:MAG: glycosyltransferase [Hyphomonas sp.]
MSDGSSSSILNGDDTYNSSSDTVIVVPCYNETERLDADAFVEFVLRNVGTKFLFVDDGSTDSTLAVLATLQARAPNVIDVLTLPKNKGKAEAVRQGMLHGLRGGASYVGYLDADLAAPLSAIVELKRVVEVLPEIEVVFGVRQRGLGRKIQRDLHRRIVSGVCAKLARVATGLHLSDTQCGSKLFKSTKALRTALSRPFDAGWLFDVELVLRLIGSDRKVRSKFYELPLMQWREIEASKIGPRDVYQSGLTMVNLIASQWKIRRQYRRFADEFEFSGRKKVTISGLFGLRDVQNLRTRVLEEAEFTQIDLSSVSEIGPSVFTALIGLCDQIKLKNKMPIILLPNCDKICQAASRSGLTALYDCRRTPEHIEAEMSHQVKMRNAS